ncbi:hypothetical protein BG015_011234 [Linnemannia schmuckeri]|uniref:Uncharacterized protein n=1 Tax=Linnemannia schmuckeri TaxID=64567 RepID=A0A9P5RTF1_9FUNG|nr:hypothetical protein BG015_011234 [Linnemannia schmuckeri]
MTQNSQNMSRIDGAFKVKISGKMVVESDPFSRAFAASHASRFPSGTPSYGVKSENFMDDKENNH